MKINVKILRFDPEKDKKSHWEVYPVEAEPGDRVLDVLNNVKWYTDSTLTFRRSCAHGICGSDAMLINGRNRLACKTLLQDVVKDGGSITVEPIRGLKVEKDLLVDMDPFFDAYRAVMPWFINDDAPPVTERIQSPEAAEHMDHGSNCILCACCTTSCPIYWVNGSYLGPAPSCRRTASSSTAATTARRPAWRSSTRTPACGAAAPRTTAPKRARATSRSRS